MEDAACKEGPAIDRNVNRLSARLDSTCLVPVVMVARMCLVVETRTTLVWCELAVHSGLWLANACGRPKRVGARPLPTCQAVGADVAAPGFGGSDRDWRADDIGHGRASDASAKQV